MNLLAFDTSTGQMSIAVQRTGQPQPCCHEAPGGALASTQLIPHIQALLAQAGLRLTELQAIVFGAGPGSFTGLRSACAVAQGLAYGAGVPVLAVDTLLAVAEEARTAAGLSGDVGITALLDARMDEIYANYYIFSSGVWLTDGGCSLIKPENLGDFVAAAGGPINLLAGNVFEPYGARLTPSVVPRLVALPTAAALLRLAPRLLAAGAAVPAAQALPVYVRNKVAQTTQERTALKLAATRAGYD